MLLDRNARPIRDGDVVLLVETQTILYIHLIRPTNRFWEFRVLRSIIDKPSYPYALADRDLCLLNNHNVSTLDAFAHYEVLYNANELARVY